MENSLGKTCYQCIAVRRRTADYQFVHYSPLFLCIFSVFYCGNLYFSISHFFMLHFFHVAPFCVTIFSGCTLFMYCYISCWTFTRFNISILHSFPVALVACCTLFMLHYFQRCSKDPYKHLRWRTLQQQLINPLNIVAKISILDVRRVLAITTISTLHFSMLHFFHVALF